MTLSLNRPLRVAMVAGEASGDLLAGLLLEGMRQRWPDLECYGIGGPQMQAQGFTAWWPYEKLAVRGYVEVLKHYREITGIRKRLAERLAADPPDLFIGVDAPDFNLHLEAQLKALNIPTVHFVSPSLWAWRGGRLAHMGKSADEVLCLFPFEPEIYHAAGLKADYVGHPLADRIPLEPPRDAARSSLGLAADQTVVALLPGSRRSEIRYIAPVMLEAARILQEKRPRLHFLWPVVPGMESEIQPLRQKLPADFPITVMTGQSHAALAACDVTLIASGTATLEAALFKCPMVITYQMHCLSWQIMKRMKYQPWVGLPNILCRDFVVPELLQEAGSPQALANAIEDWLDRPQARAALAQRFLELHQLLRRDTASAATDAIENLLVARATRS